MFGLKQINVLQRCANERRVLSVFLIGLFCCVGNTTVVSSVGGPSLPHLTWNYGSTFKAGDTFSVNCNGTHDPNNANFTCYWNFNDPYAADTPSGMTASHVYNNVGTYKVEVYACHDGVNFNDQQSIFNGCTYGSVNIDILATQPSTVTFQLNGPYYGTTGNTVVMEQTNNCASTGSCGQIHWYYGDGSDGYRNNNLPGKRAYAKAGVYQVRAKLKSLYNTATLIELSTTAEISDPPPPPPVNQPPVAVPGGQYMALVGRSVTMDGSMSSDPEGSALKYNWLFGDGTKSLNQSSSKVTKSYAIPGRYTVTLYVNDGIQDSASVTTYIDVNPISVLIPIINDLLLD